jgi:hypothetical protein
MEKVVGVGLMAQEGQQASELIFEEQFWRNLISPSASGSNKCNSRRINGQTHSARQPILRN